MAAIPHCAIKRLHLHAAPRIKNYARKSFI